MKGHEAALASPFHAVELVEVDFPGPDQDVRVAHSLNVDDPQDLVYLVLSQSAPGTVYDSRSLPGTLLWPRGQALLRISQGPARVLLMLGVRRR
jgi:hypothetical protein